MSQALLEEFKTALSRHDWYYAYSDDYSAYRRGSDSASRIQSLRRQLAQTDMKAQAEELYAKYAK